MNAWHFIVGAYVVTAIVIVIEVIAVRSRFRTARSVVSERAGTQRIHEQKSLDSRLRGNDT